ncbi:peptidylprolyl isomerase [Allorhodopirellula heiligendammensis]|uniref:Periplasmic chaperone PpiD n=1 Tax=Allorhodopirellula heiligendammensis TaxID=2714739 RepID=A0A5C6C1M6_9BACT|nr:peptidyl-prolyl cis-trans isomerase [Allorhodopirellula heiligendammensis]TWU18473.1 peptidylprolyl isomerase [Allorhodopirellula heiligendammensis]
MPPFSRLPLAHLLVVVIVVIGAAPQAWGQQLTQSQIDEAMQLQLPTDPAAVIAIVGESSILLGEINPKIEARIQEVVTTAAQEIPKDQIHFARVRMIRGLLAQTIQNRMMRESFLLDQVATQTAEKRREADAKMQAQARQMFFESEVPDLRKKYDAESTAQLDEKLHEEASSLAAREREFIDQMLGHVYLQQKVDRDPPIALSEIHEYYIIHRDDFYNKSRAKWEQITVKFENFANKKTAYDAIWNMGREAFFGGNMQAIAREKSQEPFASDGGVHDWTNQGALASQVLDEQIFSLPTGAMSQIIEDVDAYHIVRVTAREDAGVTPLADVQEDIRQILRGEKIAKAQTEALKEISRRVPVWTLFPEDIPGAKPLPQIAARPFNRQ